MKNIQKEMKGELEYKLWTVMGDKTIRIRYEIKDIDGGYNCKIKVGGDGDRPQELDNEEIMQEIVQVCIEDMKSKEAIEPDDYKRVLPDSLWGAN
jgi:hypothetical protein